MSASEAAGRRGIDEVLHYTSERGAYGAIIKGAVLSRKRLEEDPEVEFIFHPVWPVKAPQWVDHVSLSLSRINAVLFEQSRSHYRELWWGVLSFETSILDHEDVWFTTTNNIYPAVRRAQGADGLEAMFAAEVRGRYDARHTRDGLEVHQPTDRAAEVLYPGVLSLDHLACVYVPGAEQRRIVRAWCDALGKPYPSIEVRVEVFA